MSGRVIGGITTHSWWLLLLLADFFVESLKAIMLFPYVRFRSRAIHHQTPWDDILDRLQWAWQVGPTCVASICDQSQ